MKIEKLKRRNLFVSKGEYENWPNFEKYGILNGRSIPKFSKFLEPNFGFSN